MNILHVLLLSLIEGITEFLPISSTGHLVLASHLLKLAQSDFLKSFEIFIQLGAIAAAAYLYGRQIVQNKFMLAKILAAFIPTALAGLLLYPFIKGFLLENVYITAGALFTGGLLLIILEKWVIKDTGSKTTLKSLSVRDSFIIGTFQAVSVVPGISRAGATIVGGLLLNMNRKSAVEFSFMLAIPTMLAATGYDLVKNAHTLTAQNSLYLLVGMVASFVVAFVVIKWFIKYVQTKSLIPFGVYRIVLAVIYFLLFLR